MAAELKNTIESDKITNNSNLTDVIERMETLTVDNAMANTSDSDTQPRYYMRKRSPKTGAKTSSSEVLNRRCSLKPKKRKYLMTECENKIIEYYLDKKYKHKPNTNLETIFEELNDHNESETTISARSFKRSIQFNSDKRKIKLKISQRKAKIKRFFGGKVKLASPNPLKEQLMEKLRNNELDHYCQMRLEKATIVNNESNSNPLKSIF